jgi:hypothetical protein
MLGVGFGKKRALMMVEPPGDLGRAAIFEIDDGVLDSLEVRFIEELIGAVEETFVGKLRLRVDVAAEEVAENGCRTGPVKTAIVIEDADAHLKTH